MHTRLARLSDRLSRRGGPVLAVLLLAASGLLLWLWQGRQVQILSVASGSMAPAIRQDDALVVNWTNPLDIAVGDIVSYPSPQNDGVMITHRVVQVMPQTGKLVTKGDANVSADPAIHSSRVAGRVSYRVPMMGYVLNGLRTWYGLAVAVYIPTALIALGELRRLERHYGRPVYRLRSYS